ncbi:MAG: hypothetical protein AAGA48_13660 [Myxococcota bacterium]
MMIIAWLLAESAHAQALGIGAFFGKVNWGLAQYEIRNGEGPLGGVRVTLSTPDDGYLPHSEYWHWASTPWPTGDFELAIESEVTVPNTADRYDSFGLPAYATHTLPASIGGNDRLYRVSVCLEATMLCDEAGYLYVKDSGASLEWYAYADWPYRKIAASARQIVLFEHLVSVPGGSETYRFVEDHRD